MSSTSTQDPSQALPPETFLEVLSASRDSATIARSSGVNRRWREIVLSSIAKYQDLSVDLDLESYSDLYQEEQKQGLGRQGREEREEKEFERCSALMRDLSDRSLNKLINVKLGLDPLFWHRFYLSRWDGTHLQKIFNTLLLSKATLQTLSIHFKEEYEWEDGHDDEWIFLIDFLENFPNLKCAELKAPSPLIIKTQRLTIEETTNEFVWEAKEIFPIFKRAVEYGGAIKEFSLWTETNDSDAEQQLQFLQELMLHKDTLEVLNLRELTDYNYEKALELIVSCPNLISLKFPQFTSRALPDEEKVKFGIQDINLLTPPIKKFDFSCNLNGIKILWNAPLIKCLGRNLEILHLTNPSEDSKSPFMPLESLCSIFENNSQSLTEISLRDILLEDNKEVNFVPENFSLCFPTLKSITLSGTSEPKVISFFSCSILPSLSVFDIKPKSWGRYCIDPHVIPHSDLLRLLESSSSTLEQVTLTQVHVARLPDSPTQGITFPRMRILTIDACSEELFQASLSFYCPQLKIWEFINDRADWRTYNKPTQSLLPTFPIISEKLYPFLSSSQSSIARILMQGVDLEDSKQEPISSQQLLTFPSLETLEFKRTNDSLVKFFSYHSFPSLLKLKEKQRYETFISLFTPKAEKDSARK